MKNTRSSERLQPKTSDVLSKILFGRLTKVAPLQHRQSDEVPSTSVANPDDMGMAYCTHSDILSKSLMSKLAKVTRKQLEQDGIVMSPQLSDGLPQVEIKYLLDNMIPTEELIKIDNIQNSISSLTSNEEQYICQYCQKLKRFPEETCCESKEIQVYLSKCEDQKLLKRYSSYSFNNATSEESLQSDLENVKLIGEMHKSIQERRSKVSLNRFMEIKKDKANNQRKEQFRTVNFEKHKGTFSRIQKKMENIKKYCPEMYKTEESIIAMWAGASNDVEKK